MTAVLLPLSTAQFVTKNDDALEENYLLGLTLGEGFFGKVYSCTHKVSGEVRVVKKILKNLAGTCYRHPYTSASLRKMAELDHPNIAKVYEWFEDDEYISQIMEPLGGGKLLDRINDGYDSYGERFIADVIKQTLRALAFMHSKGYIHKDLKPQNIMMTDKTSSSIKVVDFGLAELFGSDQQVAEELCGTPVYLAPEGAKRVVGSSSWAGFRGLTFKSDVWSTGVILFELVTGTVPFCETWPPPGDDQMHSERCENWLRETMPKIINMPMPAHPDLRKVSPSCRQLLAQMLEKEVGSRPDAAQCLGSSWFSQMIEAPAPLSPGIMQSLVIYAGFTELKRTVFFLMAYLSALPAFSELREIFTYFDVRNQGTLDADDLHQVLSQSCMAPLEIKRVLLALDRSGDQQILWTEFCAGALIFKLANSRRLIDAAFGFFDVEGNDEITVEDIEYKLAVDTFPDAWQSKWRESLQEEFEEMKASCDRRPPPKVRFLVCCSNDADEDAINRYDFRSYISQKLTLRSGGDNDKDFPKDEGGEDDPWAAQSEYGRLHHQLAKEKADVAKAMTRKDHAEKDLNDALRRQEDARAKITPQKNFAI